MEPVSQAPDGSAAPAAPGAEEDSDLPDGFWSGHPDTKDELRDEACAQAEAVELEDLLAPLCQYDEKTARKQRA